ncbi:DegT/DnrJ/EryC1/StrS family aminotransferase [Tumebacillus flagellatus]|uniref:Erythromycin biosynthesis sensory transduction protein eryC1 n=1 Tax=Tumebacillus flagellatus TaxID=1157490 RepID=A0A074LFK0_9BACL|nr:DegT/DnrJ/EryC1/StrS family aminotransferase [Tumebacillus flagellatus]KEO81021.1 erythromycin biosynthesis sensory transduction protein eryC1 [Tumebacillus flagellatus]
MQRIPVLDLQPEIEEQWEELMTAMQGVLRSGHFIMGPNVGLFEQEVAAYLGSRHAVALNSGTDALVIGLRAAGIGAGDEVITSPFTFFATGEAIAQVGAVPVFADVDPATFNLDPDQAADRITPRTKAILPVHLFGQAAEMDSLQALADLHGLQIVEDAAQAFGGEYRGKKLGAFGEVGCFSFFPSKNLGAFGDAGMLVTNSDEMAETARMLRTHGSKKKYFNEQIGYNSRLDELQAAVLRVKLPHLDRRNFEREQAALRYDYLLEDVPGLITPYHAPDRKHVYHQYTVRVLHEKRELLRQSLADIGIHTMVYYPVPLSTMPALGNGPSCPVAEQLATEVLSLPIWPGMGTDVQVRVADAVRKVLRG